MALEPYTNTYVDIDTNIFDADDLVNEFWRVADYINAWAASIDSIGTVKVYRQIISYEQDIITGSPANGVIQHVNISRHASHVVFSLTGREEGDPYRIYMVLRFQNKNTTFSISGPAGQTHSFGVNRTVYSPCQTPNVNGFYTAAIIATYGGANGLFVNVFADNSESVDVEGNDILNAVAQ